MGSTKNLEAKQFQKDYDYAKLKVLKEERKKIKKALDEINSQIMEITKVTSTKYIRGEYIFSDHLYLNQRQLDKLREKRKCSDMSIILGK